jgi:hypothetical protein
MVAGAVSAPDWGRVASHYESNGCDELSANTLNFLCKVIVFVQGKLAFASAPPNQLTR